MRRRIFEPAHDEFRALVRTFVERECLPYLGEWERQGIVDRAAWLKAGAIGLLGMSVPEEYGGSGIDDPRYNVVITEELAAAGVSGFALQLHNELILPYLLDLATDEQKHRWLPGFCTGELITAIAMSEPGAGSDLRAMRTTAVREGENYLIAGSKTFISNGHLSDLILLCCRTGSADDKNALSIIVVERDTPGFTRGRKLDKVGLKAQDTSELFFDGARVPAANLLGVEGQGMAYLARNLASERLSIAVSSVASAFRALELTKEYVRARKAFGRTIGEFQNTRFVLADLHTRAWMARSFVDACIQDQLTGELSGETAAAAKLGATELEFACVDAGVQLHGGYGWMTEYPIARMYQDSRISRILGGSNEIMKEIIGRSLDLER